MTTEERIKKTQELLKISMEILKKYNENEIKIKAGNQRRKQYFVEKK